MLLSIVAVLTECEESCQDDIGHMFFQFIHPQALAKSHCVCVFSKPSYETQEIPLINSDRYLLYISQCGKHWNLKNVMIYKKHIRDTNSENLKLK